MVAGGNQNVTELVNSISVEIGNSVGKLGALGAAFDLVGKHATKGMAAAGIAVAAFVAKGTSELVKWDTEWRNVWTLFPDVAEDAMRVTSDRVRDWARGAGRDLQEVGDAWFTAASAFGDTGISDKLLESSHQLALATGTDLQPAMESLTVALRAHSAGLGEAARYSDILTKASQLSRVSLDELSSSMSTAIGTTADFEISFEETMAAVAALTQAGDDPGEAYTQVRQVVAQLADPTKKAGANLKAATGKSFAEWRAEGKRLIDVMMMIRESAGGSSDEILSFFGRIQAGQAVLTLTGNQLDVYLDYLDQIKNASGSTAEAAERQGASVSQQWKETTAAFSAAAESFGIGTGIITNALEQWEIVFNTVGGLGNFLREVGRYLDGILTANWDQSADVVAEYVWFLDSAAERAEKAAQAEEARQRQISDGLARTQQAENEFNLYRNKIEADRDAAVRQRTWNMDQNFIRSQRTIAKMQEEQWAAEQLKEEMAAIAQETYEAGLAAAEWARTLDRAGEAWDGWMNQIRPGGPNRSATDGRKTYSPTGSGSGDDDDPRVTASGLMSEIQGLAGDFLDEYNAPMDAATQRQFFLDRRREDRATRDRYGLESYGMSEFYVSDIIKNQRFAAEIQLEAARRQQEAVESQEQANDKARREYKEHLEELQQQQMDLHKQIMEDAMGGGETNRQWFARRLDVVNERQALAENEAKRLFGLAQGAMTDEALSNLDVTDFFNKATFGTGYFGQKGGEGFALNALQRLWDEWFKGYRDQLLINEMFGSGGESTMSGFLGAAGFGGFGRSSAALSFGEMGRYVRQLECDLSGKTDESNRYLARIAHALEEEPLAVNMSGITNPAQIINELEMANRMRRY